MKTKSIIRYKDIIVIEIEDDKITNKDINEKNKIKDKLKDIYSHNLGNALQAIYTSVDLLLNPEINNKDSQEIKITLQDKLNEAAELLKEIRNL